MVLSGWGVFILWVFFVFWLMILVEVKRLLFSWGLVCMVSRLFEELEFYIICMINIRIILIIIWCCKFDKFKLIWFLMFIERGRFIVVGIYWDDFVMMKYYSLKIERFYYMLIYIRDYSIFCEVIWFIWKKFFYIKL